MLNTQISTVKCAQSVLDYLNACFSLHCVLRKNSCFGHKGFVIEYRCFELLVHVNQCIVRFNTHINERIHLRSVFFVYIRNLVYTQNNVPSYSNMIVIRFFNRFDYLLCIGNVKSAKRLRSSSLCKQNHSQQKFFQEFRNSILLTFADKQNLQPKSDLFKRLYVHC